MKLFTNKNPIPRTNASLDEFHAELDEIVKAQDVTYRDAFVQYMDDAGMAECTRKTIDLYLLGKGFCTRDVHLLADEYCMKVDLRK